MLPLPLQEFLDDFKSLERELQSDLLIELADSFVTVPAAIALPPYAEENKVPACESDAYVFSEPLPNSSLKFHFAVLNPQGISAMALAVIIDQTLSGQDVHIVARVPDEIVFDIFGRGVSMGKGMGLRSMLRLTSVLAKRAAFTFSQS